MNRPPNLTVTDGERSCSSCSHYAIRASGFGDCTLHDFPVRNFNVSDTYEPSAARRAAVKAQVSQLEQAEAPETEALDPEPVEPPEEEVAGEPPFTQIDESEVDGGAPVAP